YGGPFRDPREHAYERLQSCQDTFVDAEDEGEFTTFPRRRGIIGFKSIPECEVGAFPDDGLVRDRRFFRIIGHSHNPTGPVDADVKRYATVDAGGLRNIGAP